MGNSESSNIHKFDGCETLGYRILGVQPDSPASRAGLVSFFDFLVGANGQLLFGVDDGSGGEYFEDVDFPALLKASVDQEIELLVWNIKNKTQRFLTLTPSVSWGGKGLLGVTIRMDDYAVAEENLLRVLSVEKQSPAALAGLTPNSDYLLGTTMDSFESEDVLADVLEENVDNVVEIYVYNTQSDVVRVVTLIPSSKWGGNGLLGAEVGRGYLHRLPNECRKTLGVSFERKVSVNENHSTSCGAIDLKLNESVQLEKKSKESKSSNMNDADAANARGIVENLPQSDKLISNQNNVVAELEQSNNDNDSAEQKMAINGESTPISIHHDNDRSVLPTPNPDEDSYPASKVTKFPSIPQLQDFSLIGMSSPSSDELDGDLPPPPISHVLDDSQEGELSAVDLR